VDGIDGRASCSLSEGIRNGCEKLVEEKILLPSHPNVWGSQRWQVFGGGFLRKRTEGQEGSPVTAFVFPKQGSGGEPGPSRKKVRATCQ